MVLDCIASGTLWVDMQALWSGCADQCTTKGLERLPVCWPGHAEPACQ